MEGNHWWAICCHHPKQSALQFLWVRSGWVLSLHGSLSDIDLSLRGYDSLCILCVSLLFWIVLDCISITYSEIDRFLDLWVSEIDAIVHLGHMLDQSLIFIVTHHSFYVLTLLNWLIISFGIIPSRFRRCFLYCHLLVGKHTFQGRLVNIIQFGEHFSDDQPIFLGGFERMR